MGPVERSIIVARQLRNIRQAVHNHQVSQQARLNALRQHQNIQWTDMQHYRSLIPNVPAQDQMWGELIRRLDERLRILQDESDDDE